MAWGPVRYVSRNHRAGRTQEGSWLVRPGCRDVLMVIRRPMAGVNLRPRVQWDKTGSVELQVLQARAGDPVCLNKRRLEDRWLRKLGQESKDIQGHRLYIKGGGGSDKTRAATSAWPRPPESSLTSHGTSLRCVEQSAPMSCTAAAATTVTA